MSDYTTLAVLFDRKVYFFLSVAYIDVAVI